MYGHEKSKPIMTLQNVTYHYYRSANKLNFSKNNQKSYYKYTRLIYMAQNLDHQVQ